MKTKMVTISKIIKKYHVAIEAVVGITAIAFLIYIMRSMLIFGETTLVHDNLIWNYPVFQFFAENIINGHFPLWDPFSYAGEPFYPIIGQMRLFEPVALLTIYFGQFITNDIILLFNWNRFLQSLVMAFGVYIVFRPLAANLFVRLSLIPILLYSSFMLGSFRQDGILNQFLWIPFITYFLLRIVYYKDCRWHNWLMLAGVIGINWQSYFFAGTWVFLLFFSVGIMLFRKDLIAEMFKTKLNMLKLAVMAFIIFAMAMPNIAIMLEKDKYIFPARIIDFTSYEGEVPQGGPVQYEAGHSLVPSHGIIMPYKVITFTGTFSSIWDLIQIISPDGNKHIKWPGRNLWGKPSEAFMYLGLLPWAIAILGIVAGRHDLKRVWLLIFIAFGLLMLGPSGGLHRLLYYIYPPMLFVRHTHAFVLFFVFAFLYFYILGFNHFFSTWGGQIFLSNRSKGILASPNSNNKKMSAFNNFMDAIKRLREQCISQLRIKNNEENIFRLQGEIKALELVVTIPELKAVEADYYKKSKGIAILMIPIIIFSAWIVTSVYLMTKLIYPATNYMFVLIIIIVAMGWLLRKDLGSSGLYVSLIVSHILIVFIFSANTTKFIRDAFLALGLPIILFVIIRLYKSNSLFRYAPLIMLSVFSVALTGDLVYNLRKSSLLYQSEKHPATTRDIKTTVHKPFLPQKRFIYPNELFISDSGQNMRYLSLIYRQPFVFSSIMESDYSGAYVKEKGIFQGLNNKSFESWVVSSKKGKLLPEQFTYHQDGIGGDVEKYTGYDGVKDGRFSVLLRPSSNANSYIRYKTSNIDEIRGQYIKVSLWVKSQNKYSSSIQVDIQDYMNAPVVKSYTNSGEWEKLTVVKYINEDTENLAVTCNIKSSATAPVYLDGFTIEIVEVNTNSFEYALKSKRWSSFLLSRKYFKLINMDISPSILEEMFAVDKSIFQFKQGIARVQESEIPAFLKQLGGANSVELLRKAIIVDEDVEPSLDRFNVLPVEYKKTIPGIYSLKKFKDTKNILDKKREKDFTYSIGEYGHNSFDMQVSTNDEGILYWADGYDKGWHAYINGKEVPIYRANINFKAFPLPKGTNNIKFIYNPFLFKTGLFVFYVTLIICLLATLIIRGFNAFDHNNSLSKVITG